MIVLNYELTNNKITITSKTAKIVVWGWSKDSLVCYYDGEVEIRELENLKNELSNLGFKGSGKIKDNILTNTKKYLNSLL
ncbi:MAG: hypothetical protein KDH96_05200 [Candidatus Riesia sp.]|nr:hypothetical protein [Candidatus Riesia sp.]